MAPHLSSSTPPTHRVTTKGSCNLVRRSEMDRGSNVNALSLCKLSEFSPAVVKASLTLFGLE